MRKNSRLVIIAIILSLLTFKQIAYSNESLIEKSKNITVNYAIDPLSLGNNDSPGKK